MLCVIEALTCHTGEQLPSKVLNLTTGEGDEAVALQKIKNTLPKQVRDNANMVAIIEAIAQMDAFVSILPVV